MNEIQLLQLPNIDTAQLNKEDRKNREFTGPCRFGYAFSPDINLNNSGTWDTLKNRKKIRV